MTEEEEKAIEDLKKLCIEVLKDDDLSNYDNLSPSEKMTMVSIVLNLIQKKDNGIEELAEKLITERLTTKTLSKNVLGYQENEKKLQKELEKKDTTIAWYKQMYENLRRDFKNYKNDKDINYLDEIHHKQLVEKSIGQMIDKPEECWFDIFEVQVIKNNKLYGIAIQEDFVTLKQISDESPEECITVIAESPLSGAIYRYNNYGKKEWQLIGTMLGYA